MEFSWIQQHVLLQLVRGKSARVKDLMPRDVPANQFAYHLDGLAKAVLIKKVARGEYTLTAQGEKEVGLFSTSTVRKHENIKTVIMLYAKTGDQYLLYKWSRQPYIGKITPLYARVPRDKSLDDALLSTAHDKLGQTAPLHYKQSVFVRIIHEGVLVSHMNAYVYEVDVSQIQLPYDGRNGTTFLGSISDADVMAGVGELFDKLTTARQPFEVMFSY